MTYGDRPDVVSVRIQRRERIKRGPWSGFYDFVKKGDAVREFGLGEYEVRLAFSESKRLNKPVGKYRYRVVRFNETDAGTYLVPLDTSRLRQIY